MNYIERDLLFELIFLYFSFHGEMMTIYHLHFRYVGSVSAMVYIFTLPPVVQMLAQYREGELKPYHVAFYGVFIVIGVANFIAQFLVS